MKTTINSERLRYNVEPIYHKPLLYLWIFQQSAPFDTANMYNSSIEYCSKARSISARFANDDCILNSIYFNIFFILISSQIANAFFNKIRIYTLKKFVFFFLQNKHGLKLIRISISHVSIIKYFRFFFYFKSLSVTLHKTYIQKRVCTLVLWCTRIHRFLFFFVSRSILVAIHGFFSRESTPSWGIAKLR